MLQGEIVRWNRERGFGFIKSSAQEGDVFLHISQWPQGVAAPRAGLKVSFRIAKDAQGRARAEHVALLGAKSAQTSQAGPQSGRNSGASARKPQVSASTYTRVAAIAGLVIVLAAVAYAYSQGGTQGMTWLGLWYVGISAITFAAFGWDKLQAQTGGWRTRENTLHALSLIGGWPGGLLAMRLFRHKTRKLSFQLLFWLAVIANIYLLSGDQLGLLGHLRLR